MPRRMTKSVERSRRLLAFVCTSFELESDGATCPTLLRHITFKLFGDLLKLAQYFDLVRKRIESPAGNFQTTFGYRVQSSFISAHLSAPMLFLSPRSQGSTTVDPMPRYALNNERIPSSLSIRKITARCVCTSPHALGRSSTVLKGRKNLGCRLP